MPLPARPADAVLALVRLVGAEFAALYDLEGRDADPDGLSLPGPAATVPDGAPPPHQPTLLRARRARRPFIAVAPCDGQPPDLPRPVTHLLAAPVRGPERTTKVLVAGLRARPALPARTLWLAECHAALLAMWLYDPGAYHDVLDAGHVDWLTGCLTFRALERELRREVNRSARGGLPLSCCFIDLDDFKTVNDRHGHVYGNRVLAEVGQTLRDAVRSCDTVGRYGGDEFVAVLPQTSLGEAAVIAERLQAAVRSIVLPDRPGEHPSASVGLAQWQPGQAAETLLAGADAALLKAKAERVPAAGGER